MKAIKEDVKIIRESQIRMEEDIKHHIRRTDLLEEMITPPYKLYQFGKQFLKLLGVVALILGLFWTSKKVMAAEIDEEVIMIGLRSNCTLQVTSGYRDVWDNLIVGGAEDSMHLLDKARDIVPLDCDIEFLLEYISPGITYFIYNTHLHIDNRS